MCECHTQCVIVGMSAPHSTLVRMTRYHDYDDVELFGNSAWQHRTDTCNMLDVPHLLHVVDV